MESSSLDVFLQQTRAQQNNQQNELETATGSNKSPKYIIKCDNLFQSNIRHYEDFAPCNWIKTGGARIGSRDAASRMYASNKIVGQDPIINVDCGPWGSLLHECMYDGTILHNIQVYRLSVIEGTQSVVQQLNYSCCIIRSYEQTIDKITFSFCFQILEDLHINYGVDNNLNGYQGMKYDITKMELSHSDAPYPSNIDLR